MSPPLGVLCQSLHSIGFSYGLEGQSLDSKRFICKVLFLLGLSAKAPGLWAGGFLFAGLSIAGWWELVVQGDVVDFLWV